MENIPQDIQNIQEICVIGIYPTRNPMIKTLALHTRVEKSALTNPIGFFLNTNYEERYAYVPVSTGFIERYNIKLGDNFASSINRPCKIVVREGFKPFRMTRDRDGKLVPQLPKRVPNTDIFLKKGGVPIYRHTILVLNTLDFEDVYIAHDPLTDEEKEIIKSSRSNYQIITEPELE
jgi:hypothetical protein